MRALLCAAIAFALGGCTSNGSLVVLAIDAAPQLDGVATLAVVARAGGIERSFDVTPPRATIPPAVSIGIEIPPSVTGTMHVEVTARDAGGATLGAAGADVGITTGGVASLPLTLRSDGGGDLAAATDLAGTDILAATDMLDGNDLAPVRDMTAPLDLQLSSLTFLPSTKDFLAVNEGSASASYQFTVQNNGTAPTAALQAPTLTGTHAAQFTIDNNTCLAGLVLTVNATCTITVTFRPTGAGLRSASVVLTDGMKSGSATLTGRAVGNVGRACGSAVDCQNGQCVDGYCCNMSTCTGCNACNVASKEGTCSPVPVGQDPRGTCASVACSTKKCNGAGACGAGQAGSVCQTDSCTGSIQTVHICDGANTGCPIATTTQGCPGGYACANATTCRTSCASDNDCNPSTSFCTTGNVCTALLQPGATCSRNRQCSGNICDQGICRRCTHGRIGCLSNSDVCIASPDGGNQCASCFHDGIYDHARCVAAGRGNTCNANGLCTCSSSGQCSNVESPYCLTESGVSYCACYQTSPYYSSCQFGTRCVASVPENLAQSCKGVTGNPCGGAADCASGVCNAGVCQ